MGVSFQEVRVIGSEHFNNSRLTDGVKEAQLKLGLREESLLSAGR